MNSTSEIGGAELSLLPVARLLAVHHDVVAFLPGRGPLHDELQTSGVEIRPFPLGAALARTSRQYGSRGAIRVATELLAQQTTLFRALRAARLDVLYCNGFRAQLGASLPARAAGVPVVWHVRDFIPTSAAGRVFTLLCRSAAVVIANSEATAAQPAMRGAVRVIPNGIDLGHFRERDSEPHGSPRIGMVGHLTPWKGHRRFLRIMRLVRRTLPEARGAIAGAAIYHTADHAEYAMAVASEAAEGDCALEAVPPGEMPGWLSGLSVLVHCPERPEPFGRAIAEAMAVGVPVVVASGGGASEVVGDAGILLPDQDNSVVAAAVVDLVREPQRRKLLSAAGVERSRTRFDEQRYAAATVEAVLSAVRR